MDPVVYVYSTMNDSSFADESHDPNDPTYEPDASETEWLDEADAELERGQASVVQTSHVETEFWPDNDPEDHLFSFTLKVTSRNFKGHNSAPDGGTWGIKCSNVDQLKTKVWERGIAKKLILKEVVRVDGAYTFATGEPNPNEIEKYKDKKVN